MTAKQAERITGYEVVVSRFGRSGNPDPWSCDLMQDGVFVTTGYGANRERAISNAVEQNYRRIKDRVFMAQWRRCFVCGRLRPLQADHCPPRARGGRRDTFEHLRGVCAECHERITLNQLKDPPPHPRIAALMESAGWQWGGEKTGWLKLKRNSN